MTGRAVWAYRPRRSEDLRASIEAPREKLDFEMDDDFNTAGALAAVFELAKAANTFIADYQTDLCEDDRLVLRGRSRRAGRGVRARRAANSC